MADLVVDDAVLATCEEQLSRLHRELRTLAHRRDALHTAWGAGPVAAAMDGFVDDWSHYRHRLLGGIEAVATAASRARTTFRRTDDRLARAAAGPAR